MNRAFPKIPITGIAVLTLCALLLSCAANNRTREAIAPIQQQVGELQKASGQQQMAIGDLIRDVSTAREQAAQAAERAKLAEQRSKDLEEALEHFRKAPTPPPPKPELGTPTLPPGVKAYREVFFATDRGSTNNGTFNSQCSEGGRMTYGRAIVSIPEIHRIGEEERPWHFDVITFPESANRHIIISRRELLGSTVFFTNVREAIASSPEDSAFVFIHGYNVSFDDAVLRVGQLAYDLKFRGPAIAYSWPSRGGLAGYLSDVEMAEWTTPHLEVFLRELRAKTGAKTIHLIGHSMGGRVLTRALERVANLQPTARPPHFQEVVLAAPDINVEIFRQLAAALQRTSDRVTVYCSRRDLALRVSAILRGETIRTGSYLVFPGFDVIDATRIATSSLLGHSYIAENEKMLNYLALLLKQRLGPDQRSITMETVGPIWAFRRRVRFC